MLSMLNHLVSCNNAISGCRAIPKSLRGCFSNSRIYVNQNRKKRMAEIDKETNSRPST